MSKLTSTIIESMPPVEKPFPKIMKDKNNNEVVLFSKYKVGTALYCPNSNFKPGDRVVNWDMDDFEDIDYPLTIIFNMED